MNLIPNTILDPPVIKTTTVKITSFAVSVISLELFKSATLSVMFYSDSGVVDSKIIILKDDDYMLWKDDDQYIIDYVIRNISD